MVFPKKLSVFGHFTTVGFFSPIREIGS